MPIVLNGSIPLPNLKIYTTASILLLTGCLYYAISVTSDPYWKLQNNSTLGLLTSSDDVSERLRSTVASNIVVVIGEDGVKQRLPIDAAAAAGDDGGNENREPRLISVDDISDLDYKKILTSITNDRLIISDDQMYPGSRTISMHLKDIVAFMSQEPFCIWTLINMAYCCLILLGKSIQKVVFGELRISEQQHMKDKFWNFIFYKFIFVFGVVNVQYLHEVVLWVSWFSALGFLHLLSQLSKDRFEYLSFSPTTPGWSHIRLIVLLSTILTFSGGMFLISIAVGYFNGINTFAFMAAECVLLAIRTLHVLIRYGMFLYDMRQGGITNESVSWEKRGPVAYYIELSFEVVALIIDLLHHLHMLLWSNIFLSMASLVIVMQLRYLTNEIQRKVKKHRNYLWVLNHMEKSYPLASAEDLSQNSDNCAICWEKMETARKLPCSHLFHNSCLQSWLEQDTSCPTCRLGLSIQSNTHHTNPSDIRIDDAEPPTRAANNHFFHFNGSRYVSWLPNFSVEVTHINNVLRNEPVTQANNHTSQLRNMGRHVQEMFPRFPLSVLISDLQISRSIEVTIDNILEGRLQVPTRFPDDDMNDEFFASSSTSTNNLLELSSDGLPTAVYPVTSASDYYVNAAEFNPNMQYSTNNDSNSSLSSCSNGYEIETCSSIFGNQNDLLREDSCEDLPLGDRFSKSPEERERILQRRKEQLLSMARKKYLEKNKSELNMTLGDSTIRQRSKNSMEEND